MPAPRTLLPYQAAWVQDQSPLKVCQKSRRIGLSFTEAYDCVLHAGGGTGNCYYQSYDHEMTKGFINDCVDWAELLQIGAEAVGEILVDVRQKDGSIKQVAAHRLPLASGKEIVAMTSAPRAFRSKGRPGDRAIIDEAAFVEDLEESLRAAMAFLMWGGSVHVLSTHNGKGSPFNTLVNDILSGEQPGSVHTYPFRLALEQGFYRRICEATGKRWSPKAEADYEAGVRSFYGRGASQELDCVPDDILGAWIAWDLIRGCEDADAGRPELAGQGDFYLGVDIARRRDFWVCWALELVGDVLWSRELVVRRDIAFSEQHALLDECIAKYRPKRVVIDQTGMGEEFVEIERRKHGALIEGALMTGPRRLDIATLLLSRFQDRRIRIQPDDALRKDIYSVRSAPSATGGPRLVAEEKETDGHADRFWAGALACAAAAGPAAEYAYIPAVPGRDTPDFVGAEDEDLPQDSFGPFSGRLGGFAH